MEISQGNHFKMTAADTDPNAIGLYIPVSTPEIHDVTYYAVQILWR